MVFYPDNVPRATRLEQLVNSMADMQTDIQDYADRMDKRGKQIRPVIDKLLKEQGIDNIDELIEKSTDQFSTDDERRFRKLIDAAKRNGKLNWEELVAGLLLGPAGGKLLSAEKLLAVGRFSVRATGVQAIADFLRTAQDGGAANLPAAAEKLIKAAGESEKALQVEAAAAAEAGPEAAEAVEEISKAANAASKVAVCMKLLGAIGFIATIVVSIVELVKGAEQKTRLIEAIHNAQPARLCIAYFAAEAKNIIEQLELCASYVEIMADKEDPTSDATAKKLHDKLIQNITTDDALINWKKLQKGFESEDKKSSSYYGDDDLDSTEVVRLAKASEKDSRDGNNDD